MIGYIALAAGILVAKRLIEHHQASVRIRAGYEREFAAARYLKSCGAKEVSISEGSRGAADIKVIWPNGSSWKVQIKSSISGKPRLPSPEERKRLIIAAARGHRSIPVIGLSSKSSGSWRTFYYHAKTLERLYPAEWA
jgi:hypothetical protein